MFLSLASQSFLTVRPGFVNNSRIVRECRHCLNLLSGRFTSAPLGYSFRNPLRLNFMCHLPRSIWPLRGNSFGTPIYPGSMRSPVTPLDSLATWWIEGVPTNYLDLVMTSSQPSWPCLRVIALWADTRKEWGPHLTTSAVDKDLLKRLWLLSTFFTSARFSLGADVGYLAHHFLSSWRSYHLLISRI